MICNCAKEVSAKISENNPEFQNVSAPVELLSGKIYLTFKADKETKRGKNKRIDLPFLLKKCPFCGQTYE